MKTIGCLLAAIFLGLVSAKPASDRERRQSPDQYCSRQYGLSTTSAFNKNLIQECSSSTTYPNGANWQWAFNLPGLASQYLNIQYNIRTESQSTCSFDRLTFGSSVTVCGFQQGSFSVDVSGRTSYEILFSSDGSVTGDLLQVDISLSNSAYYSTSNLPNYLSSGQAGEPTDSTPPYNTWTSPSYSDWTSPSYSDWSSPSYFPTSSSYNPYDYASSYPQYSSTNSWDQYSSTYYPQYSSTNSWDQYSSTYYPWQSSSNSWDQYSSTYYPQYSSTNSWDQYSSTYYPWQSSSNSWDQYSSTYYPQYSSTNSWDQYSSTYYPQYSSTNSWDQYSSTYYPQYSSTNSWDQYSSTYYPWQSSTNSWDQSSSTYYPWEYSTNSWYQTTYPQCQNFELIKGQLLVSLDDLVRVAQGLVSLLRQGEAYAQPIIMSAAGKK